jgi:hypothetical protein
MRYDGAARSDEYDGPARSDEKVSVLDLRLRLKLSKDNAFMSQGTKSHYDLNRRVGINLWGIIKSPARSEAARTDPPSSAPEAASAKPAGRLFGVLTMPNGQQIRTMREDAFRAALAATRISTH